MREQLTVLFGSSETDDKEWTVVKGRSQGITERLARASAAHPRRTFAAWGVVVFAAVSLVQKAKRTPGFAVAITGDHSVGNDFNTLSQRDLEHGELAFGLPAALVVLVLVFGAVVAGLVPVLMAILSILVGLGIVALLSLEFSLSVFIVNMLTGMGLALGIDYSLFVISRYREERVREAAKEEAIALAGATA